MSGREIKTIEEEIGRLLLKITNNKKEIIELKKQRNMLFELHLLDAKKETKSGR